MKNYTISDFSINTNGKTYTANGRISAYSGKYDVNYSNILTKLIQEAGRFCDCYASDLFIDWQSVESMIEAGGEIDKSFLFGFRSSGVDHDTYVFSRYSTEGNYAKYNYRSLWRLDVNADGKNINMTLGKVFST